MENSEIKDEIEKAPCWSFSSFVNEKDELIERVKAFQPQKDSKRIIEIV